MKPKYKIGDWIDTEDFWDKTEFAGRFLLHIIDIKKVTNGHRYIMEWWFLTENGDIEEQGMDIYTQPAHYIDGAKPFKKVDAQELFMKFL